MRWNDLARTSGVCDVRIILTKREVVAMKSGSQYLCDTNERSKDMARALLKVRYILGKKESHIPRI